MRHCKAEGQSRDAKLTHLGVKQANELAAFLLSKNIDYIISSTYERACQTIAPLAENLGVEIVKDERLVERVLSDTDDPNWREMLRQTYVDIDLAFAGGESSREAMNRGIAVVKDVLSSRHQNIVIVSHGNLISLILKYFDKRTGYEEWSKLTNPDVFRLSFNHSQPIIERIWNV